MGHMAKHSCINPDLLVCHKRCTYEKVLIIKKLGGGFRKARGAHSERPHQPVLPDCSMLFPRFNQKAFLFKSENPRSYPANAEMSASIDFFQDSRRIVPRAVT